MSGNASSAVLTIPEPGWFDVTLAIMHDGQLARLQADFDVWTHHRLMRDQAVFAARRHATQPVRVPTDATARLRLFADAKARIRLFDGSIEVPACAFPLEAFWPYFDCLPNGRWIVADSRCIVRTSNARLLDADGDVLHRLCLGDGISQLQCDQSGFVWAGYSDEGILGRGGWGLPGGPPPIGAPGLNMFDEHGEVRWAHDAFADGSSGRTIADCASLNVCGDEVWTCYQSHNLTMNSHPIVRLRGGVEDAWDTPLSLVQAIAIDGFHVAAITYPPHEPHRVSLLQLAGRGCTVLGEAGASVFGIEPGPAATVLGRGAALHVVTDGRWLTLTVAQIRAHFELADT